MAGSKRCTRQPILPPCHVMLRKARRRMLSRSNRTLRRAQGYVLDAETSVPEYPVLRGAWNALEGLVFGSRLVFNQSWEDPAVDQQALNITPDDTVVTIASAGDNVLSLALAQPRRIYAVDLNPTQVWLLKLKIVAAQKLDYTNFWHLFSLAPASRADAIYHASLRCDLDTDARRFWDANLGLLRSGLCRGGLFGRALLLLRIYLRIVCGRRALERFFEFHSLSEQATFYRQRIHPRAWNILAKLFAGHWPVLLLFGVHPVQAQRIRSGQIADMLAKGMARVLTTIPARDNYFWQQAFLGRYLVPPLYLRPENFSKLKQVVSRVEAHVGRIEDFIRHLPPQSISCFNLLDALDWLSVNQTTAWWTLLQRAAAPQARVLFRTIDPGYRLPTSVLDLWDDRSRAVWTARERTGVYGGVHLYVLRAREAAG